jgi:Cu/Ag efflux protein CusF
MRITLFLLLFLAAVGSACQSKPANSPVPGAPGPAIKDGDYKGSGKVTKINNELGSIEMDHGDFPGLMPAMRMEFYVSDKAMLQGIAVGDSVDFTILHKGGTETITKLTKK